MFIVIAGQYSPISQRRRSRSPLRDRETENRFHRRCHNRIIQRYRTQSSNMTEDQLRQRHQDPDVPMEYTPPEVDRNQPDPGSIQSPHLHDQQREEHPTCRICQQQLEEGAEIRRLSCSHQFHALCIFRWAQERDSTCPICQETFPWYMTVSVLHLFFFSPTF